MGTVKILQSERAEIQKELTKLDKATEVLQELSAPNSTPSPDGKRRTFSAAARRKMAKAQKKRWAKVKLAQKTKSKS